MKSTKNLPVHFFQFPVNLNNFKVKLLSQKKKKYINKMLMFGPYSRQIR